MTGLFASSPLRYIPHRRVLSEASITKSERRQPSEFAAFRPYFGVNDIGLWNKVNLTLTSIHFENVQCLFGLQLTLDMFNSSTLWVWMTSELPPTNVILKRHGFRTQFSSLTLTTSPLTHPCRWFKHMFLLVTYLVSLLDFGARMSCLAELTTVNEGWHHVAWFDSLNRVLRPGVWGDALNFVIS